MKTLVTVLCLAALAGRAGAAETSGYALSVLVAEDPRPEYHARGNVYVEAVRGQNYSLRITNPMPYRVAVALSVDGLNTIDAKHTDPSHAGKWVLEPYESTVISGWQVSGSAARRFFFTGERSSYGAALGQTDNLGVIEAVFYRERARNITVYVPRSSDAEPSAQRKESAPSIQSEGAAAPAPSEDFAATGMGDRTRHDIERVDIELEPRPVASVRIRYEFRPALIQLGVLTQSPLDRREHARGFDTYCPQPEAPVYRPDPRR